MEPVHLPFRIDNDSHTCFELILLPLYTTLQESNYFWNMAGHELPFYNKLKKFLSLLVHFEQLFHAQTL